MIMPKGAEIHPEITETSSHAGAFAADNGGTHPTDRLLLAKEGGIEEVVGGFLEGSATEDAGLLLLHAVAGDGDDIAMMGHDVDEKHDVAGIDKGAVRGDEAP